MRLGRVLKAWRQAHLLDQKDLAAQIGIPASVLCRIERGKEPAASTMLKIITWIFGATP